MFFFNQYRFSKALKRNSPFFCWHLLICENTLIQVVQLKKQKKKKKEKEKFNVPAEYRTRLGGVVT